MKILPGIRPFFLIIQLKVMIILISNEKNDTMTESKTKQVEDGINTENLSQPTPHPPEEHRK